MSNKSEIELRRELHTYPESGWTEFRTTARIIEELEDLGLKVEYGPSLHVREKMFGLPDDDVLEACWQRAMKETDRPDLVEAMKGGYTGCLTRIEGALPGPLTGIRVDIDCNDVTEAADEKHLPYREGFASKHPGCMHACGHDAHTAIGIGLARRLVGMRDSLRGTVLLVFQPGEEGLRGAASMTAAGLFSDCDYFIGSHIGLRNYPLGTVAVSSTGILSSTKLDVFYEGKPAHAGVSPQLGHNALAAAAAAALNLLAIPRHGEGASRINIGTLEAGSGRNVIPANAKLTLETRGATPAINDYMETAAMRVIKTAAEMYECSWSAKYMGGANSVECDKELAAWIAKLVAPLPGVTGTMEDFPFGGGEDVTTMMRDVQAHGGRVTEMAFPFPLVAPHHNNYFDIDEKVIDLVIRVYTEIAMKIAEFGK